MDSAISPAQTSLPMFDAADAWLPAISMWQPYASLLFADDPTYRKLHETRGRPYPPKYAGHRIVIQAGLSLPKQIPPALEQLAHDAFGGNWRLTVPRGYYIGTAVLGGCQATDNMREHIEYADRVAGIWDAGRYAWTLSDRSALVQPIPGKGKQGWWMVRASALDLAEVRAPGRVGNG